VTERTSIDVNPFYQAYDRQGEGTVLKPKHIRQYRNDFVVRSGFSGSMSVLELGCGNGLFLRFLDSIGVADFVGVDGDTRVLGELSAALRDRVVIADFDAYLAKTTGQRTFDRVVMFDVLEHFPPADAAALLGKVGGILAPEGRIVIRVPNMASPFGLGMQYNDVTHLTAFTPGALRQVARTAGLTLHSAHPQAYGSARREMRERLLTSVLSFFMAMPPPIWTPAFIGVLGR
jgi:2-polyprenyl-3-methyl-5-hydroxy-6-metoxy-1,4-benzoquinol methylase